MLIDEYLDASELTRFLEKATIAECLAVIRDASIDLISMDESCIEIITAMMERMGLMDERKRMLVAYNQ